MINLQEMVSLLTKEDPRTVYTDMMANNEDFNEFIERNKAKSTQEMILYYNLDYKIREITGHV